MSKMERMDAIPRMSDQELDRFCWAWNQWCFTRKYYIAPGCRSFLARMQPAKVCDAPDARLSADLAYFHQAVHALADMPGSEPECFISFYALVQQNEFPIKTIAAKLGVCTKTFYLKKNRFARKALSLASSLKATREAASQAENCHVNID